MSTAYVESTWQRDHSKSVGQNVQLQWTDADSTLKATSNPIMVWLLPLYPETRVYLAPVTLANAGG